MRQKNFLVTVDGRLALRGSCDFYDAAAWTPFIGRSGPTMAYASPFSGQILSWRRLAAPVRRKTGQAYFGPIALHVTLPPFTGARSEPVLCTGVAGRADLVYITYLNDHEVCFGYDHWSRGGPTSAPVQVDYAAEHTLIIDSGALHAAGFARKSNEAERSADFSVVLDGRRVAGGRVFSWPAAPDTTTVGTNPVLASSAGSVFSGAIFGAEFTGKQ